MPNLNMTCDSANKRIRQLTIERSRILSEERANQTYAYIQGEEPYQPEYSFANTQKALDAINEEIISLKHAVNLFNTTHIVPGTELTIDQALVRLPMLTEKKTKLEHMLVIQPKTRRTLMSGNASEFTVRNFDVTEVQAMYDDVSKEIVTIQQGLSTINLTELL